MDVGRAVRKQLRRGDEIKEVARQLDCPCGFCKLALAFVNASDLLKFRAIVEDWPLKQVIEELGFARYVADRAFSTIQPS